MESVLFFAVLAVFGALLISLLPYGPVKGWDGNMPTVSGGGRPLIQLSLPKP
jgi:hypothetical protein